MSRRNWAGNYARVQHRAPPALATKQRREAQERWASTAPARARQGCRLHALIQVAGEEREAGRLSTRISPTRCILLQPVALVARLASKNSPDYALALFCIFGVAHQLRATGINWRQPASRKSCAVAATPASPSPFGANKTEATQASQLQRWVRCDVSMCRRLATSSRSKPEREKLSKSRAAGAASLKPERAHSGSPILRARCACAAVFAQHLFEQLWPGQQLRQRLRQDFRLRLLRRRQGQNVNPREHGRVSYRWKRLA